MPGRFGERPTIRAALLLGFGLTLGLWLFAGYSLTRRMAEVQNEATQINARYTHAQDLLSTVRAQVLLGSVYVRDALLDPNVGTVSEYRKQIRRTYESIDIALNQYIPVLDSPVSHERLQGLRREIDQYHSTMLEVLAGDSSRWPTDARSLLRTRIVPRREVVIRVSEEVQALNRTAFVQQQGDLATIYATTQRRIWQQFGFALVASFAIGLIATRYAGQLEQQIRLQMAKEAETTRDLQRLSSQLIKAQEDERRTIARELHDEVGGVLTVLKMELARAERHLDVGPAAVQALAPARSIADSALQTVRDLSRLLHPAILDDLGLPAAIDCHLRGFGSRYGVIVTLQHEGMEQRLPSEVEAAAYRIVQEALTNVVKHAHAKTCRVHLQRRCDSLLITIEDDGVGFESSEAEQPAERRGLGLIGIRERAAHLRGTVRVESTIGRGTRVAVTLPIEPTIIQEGV